MSCHVVAPFLSFPSFPSSPPFPPSFSSSPSACCLLSSVSCNPVSCLSASPCRSWAASRDCKSNAPVLASPTESDSWIIQVASKHQSTKAPSCQHQAKTQNQPRKVDPGKGASQLHSFTQSSTTQSSIQSHLFLRPSPSTTSRHLYIHHRPLPVECCRLRQPSTLLRRRLAATPSSYDTIFRGFSFSRSFPQRDSPSSIGSSRNILCTFFPLGSVITRYQL
jgi:hypothetical protein